MHLVAQFNFSFTVTFAKSRTLFGQRKAFQNQSLLRLDKTLIISRWKDTDNFFIYATGCVNFMKICVHLVAFKP